MRYQPNCDVKRWLAYFDILGVRELVAAGKEGQVFDAYDWALQQFDSHKGWPEVRHAWFSDTFLIVAPDDSRESFGCIDWMARYFVNSMLLANIPLRGAISCDHLYADFTEGIFLGNALIEAYEYGEGQDWIGLLLCPTAIGSLTSRGARPDPSDYTLWKVPWKRRPAKAPDELFACFVGKVVLVDGHNPRIESLQGMMSRVSCEEQRVKYVRTIEFLRKDEYAVNG